jgi:hypothetical protein
MGGLVKKGWCHVPIPLTQRPIPFMDPNSTFCVVQEHVPKDWWSERSQKDMCRLELRKLRWPDRPVTLGTKYEKLNDDDLHCRSPSLSVMSYHSPNLIIKVGNRNKPAPHIEVPLHKMVDITFLYSVTSPVFPLIYKTDQDRYMEPCPKEGGN